MVSILKSKKQVVWAVHVAALFVCWGAEPVMSRFLCCLCIQRLQLQIFSFPGTEVLYTVQRVVTGSLTH